MFCVSNIAAEYNDKDIIKHCSDNGIRVLFCFDITKADRQSRSFKIAVATKDYTLFTNSMLWPQRVFVRPWNNITEKRSVEHVERVGSQPALDKHREPRTGNCRAGCCRDR